jgi:peptidoglycan LD-endopeptidase LytH
VERSLTRRFWPPSGSRARELAGILLIAAGCGQDESDRFADTSGSVSQAPVLETVLDTLAGLDADSLASAADQVRVTSITSDTAAIHATSAELAELGAGLVIPVTGVERGELHDSFAESRGTRPHDAIDIVAPRGTAVVSAADGRLLKLHNSVPGGLMVYAADASNRFILMYGHLDAYAPGLAEGMPLRRGQLLGYVGTTGNAPPGTPHLHFAIARGRPDVSWSRGTAVNPYPLLTGEAP